MFVGCELVSCFLSGYTHVKARKRGGLFLRTKKVANVCQFRLQPEDNQRLASLCGQLNEHLKLVEKHFQVLIRHRGHAFEIEGVYDRADAASAVVRKLYDETAQSLELSPYRVHLSLQSVDMAVEGGQQGEESLRGRKKLISPKNKHQAVYLKNIRRHDVNFGIGPAGTGKTFLAVAAAAVALDREEIQRVVLVRPAVEAGESLGYLPGDFSQKVEPYLRPMYDALSDIMGLEWVNKYLERNQIEVAPLAYMRGRTLNDSFIILDEAQNTTVEQMKMFLTRLGFGSTAVITGDITQIDLPSQRPSGLCHALDILRHVGGIGFTYFQSKDAVRHRLVTSIVDAYEKGIEEGDDREA
jgi:phosphate starvation-inducible PhoH-like protein